MDINPLAVELAKLSLWVATAGKGVPLSFLNHHLRCGDSLLGVFSDEFHHDLFAQKLVQQMALAVGFIRYINDNYSKTLKDIGKKEENLRIAREHLRRFRVTYDCHLAPLFGLNIAGQFHAWLDGITDPARRNYPLGWSTWKRSHRSIASSIGNWSSRKSGATDSADPLTPGRSLREGFLDSTSFWGIRRL